MFVEVEGCVAKFIALPLLFSIAIFFQPISPEDIHELFNHFIIFCQSLLQFQVNFSHGFKIFDPDELFPEYFHEYLKIKTILSIFCMAVMTMLECLLFFIMSLSCEVRIVPY